MARFSSGNSIAKSTINWLRKNELYSQLSTVFGVILLVGLTNDFVQYTIAEQPLLTTQSFTYIVLVFHVISVLMSVQAYIYTTLRFKSRSDRLSINLMGFNGLLFLLRVVLELTLINYRREHYAN